MSGWRNLEDVDLLTTELADLSGDPSRTLVDLSLGSALACRPYHFEERIVRGGAARCFHPHDREQLFPEPTDDEPRQIDPGGIVAAAPTGFGPRCGRGEQMPAVATGAFTDSTSNTESSNRGQR